MNTTESIMDHYCIDCGSLMGSMSTPKWQSKERKCDACGGRIVKAPVPPKAIMASDLNKKAPNIPEEVGDVWTLESEDEDFASNMLSGIVDKAMEGDVEHQKFLSALWDGESWESIKRKVQTEGSVWYVWWMDGVRKFMSQMDTIDVQNQNALDLQGENEDPIQPDTSASTNFKIVEAKKKKKGIGYTWMPKDKTHSGHMDTQMYPECEGTKYDRDIVKNHSFNLNKFILEAKKAKTEKTKKAKKKKWDPNPWAICNTTVNKDKDPEKFERCVKKVKKNQSFNLNTNMKMANRFQLQELKTDFTNSQILQAIKGLGEQSIAGFSNITENDVDDILPMLEDYELAEIRNYLSKNSPICANNKCKISKTKWEEMGKKAGWIKQAQLSENVVPVEQIIGTSPEGMSSDQIDQDMHSKGYFLFREHYPWGKTLSYQNKKGDKIYLNVEFTEENLKNDTRGKATWVTWDQLKKILREDWRPPSQSDQDWFVANLGELPKQENKQIPQQGNFGKNPFV